MHGHQSGLFIVYRQFYSEWSACVSADKGDI